MIDIIMSLWLVVALGAGLLTIVYGIFAGLFSAVEYWQKAMRGNPPWLTYLVYAHVWVGVIVYVFFIMSL